MTYKQYKEDRYPYMYYSWHDKYKKKDELQWMWGNSETIVKRKANPFFTTHKMTLIKEATYIILLHDTIQYNTGNEQYKIPLAEID